MRTNLSAALGLILAAVCAFPAPARGIDLRWDRQWLILPTFSAGELAVVLPDTLELRTIEVWATYDPTVVSGITARPGAVFDPVPCFLWESYEEEVPGSWHGLIVVMGGDCRAEGPGELLVWEFSTLDRTAVTAVRSIEARLYTPDAQLIPDVHLGSTYVSVGDEPAGGLPSTPGFTAGLHPNPFNPTAILAGGSDLDGTVSVEIYDLGGRLVRLLSLDGHPGGAWRMQWNGRDAGGRPLPSGTYLFRCGGPSSARLLLRGTLLR